MIKIEKIDFNRRSPAEYLGMATSLCCASVRYQGISFGSVTVWLNVAISYKQAAFAFDEIDKLVGLVTWANVRGDVISRFRRWGRCWIHHSEWTEGTIPLVIDFTAPYGRAKEISLAFRKEHRRKNNPTIRIVRWDRI